MECRKLKITMLTDYHISSGTGIPGVCDSALVKDRHDLPVLPGSTVSGVLRDLVEEWIRLAGDTFPWNSTISEWQQRPQSFVDEVFGSESTPGNVQFSCFTLPEETCDRLEQKATANNMQMRDIARDLCYFAPHVEIDDNSGIAKQGHFFIAEMGRTGLTFEGKISCDSIHSQAIFAVLENVVPSLTRLGNKRTRGLGRLRCEFLACPRAETIAHTTQPLATDATILKVKATLAEPCHIAADAFQGNHSGCRDYIPGSAILGIFAHRWLKIGGAVGQTFQNIFCSSKTRFLNLYPSVLDQQNSEFPTVPVACSWVKDKHSKDLPHWEGSEPGEELLDILCNHHRLSQDPWTDRNIQHINKGFCVLAENVYYSVAVQTGIAHHNKVDDTEKRVLEADGGPFSQEVMQEGQSFSGYIVFEDNNALKLFVDGLRLTTLPARIPITLGHAKRRGMGHAVLELDVMQCNEDIFSFATQLQDIPCGGRFIVTLLSDAILKDDWGRPVTLLTPEILQKRLVSLGATGIIIKAMQVSHYAKSDTLQGFYSHWGLPRPEETVIQKGSVFQFEITRENLPAAVIAKFNQSSIGYRCHEGFGRIAIGIPAVDNSNNYPAHHEPCTFETTSFPDFGSPAQGTLALLRNARYSGRLVKEIYRKAKDVNIENSLKPNQWSALREVALRAYQQHEKAIAAEYRGQPQVAIERCRTSAKQYLQEFYNGLLQENGEPKKGRDAWKKCRIEGQRAYEWLQSFLADDARLWDRLSFPENEKKRWLWGVKSLFLALLADIQRRK